jgi:hypothetical protein
MKAHQSGGFSAKATGAAVKKVPGRGFLFLVYLCFVRAELMSVTALQQKNNVTVVSDPLLIRVTELYNKHVIGSSCVSGFLVFGLGATLASNKPFNHGNETASTLVLLTPPPSNMLRECYAGDSRRGTSPRPRTQGEYLELPLLPPRSWNPPFPPPPPRQRDLNPSSPSTTSTGAQHASTLSSWSPAPTITVPDGRYQAKAACRLGLGRCAACTASATRRKYER